MLGLISYVAFRRTIKAQEFVVKDSQGNVRGAFGLNGLTITGSDGTSNIRLVAGSQGEVLLMTDADGKGRIYLDTLDTLDRKTTMLSLSAEGGSVDIQVSPNGREVNLQDESGDFHSTLESSRRGNFLELGYSKTKEEGIMSSDGIEFWDRNGKVIYNAGK
jgi:hypothetical protein